MSTDSQSIPISHPVSEIPDENLMQHDRDLVPGNSKTESGPVSQDSPELTIKGVRWFLICVAIFSANLLYGLDTTISADIQAAVSSTFDDVSELGWLGIGFTLGSASGILPLGKAYGIFNTKWLYLVCLINFAAASALCGAASSMSVMIVGRVWAGVGGSGMYLGTLNLITMTNTNSGASFYIGISALVYGTGCILGPVVGGLLADSIATWRWAFYLNLVLFGALSPMYLVALPSFPMQTDRTLAEKIKAFDWLGILLTTGLYVSITLALTFAGSIWAWNDARIIVLLVFSVVLATVLVVTQYLAIATTTANRLFPVDFLADHRLTLLYICMSCCAAALFVAIYYIPLYFLFADGSSGIQAAVQLLPLICTYVFVTLACGYLLPRVGYPKVWYLGSSVLLICGAAAMLTINANTPTSHIYGFSVLLGFGLTVTQASYSVATPLVEPARIPEVIQFLNAAQGQSFLLALTIASCLFQNTALGGMKGVLQGLGYSDAEIQQAITGTNSAILQQVVPEVKEEAIGVIVRSISHEWILIVIAGVIFFVCSILLTKSREGTSALSIA